MRRGGPFWVGSTEFFLNLWKEFMGPPGAAKNAFSLLENVFFCLSQTLEYVQSLGSGLVSFGWLSHLPLRSSTTSFIGRNGSRPSALGSLGSRDS